MVPREVTTHKEDYLHSLEERLASGQLIIRKERLRMAVMAIGVWFSYSCRHVEENVLLSKGEEEDLWLAMKRRSTLIRTRRLGTLLI